jgi:hypothetical protein
MANKKVKSYAQIENKCKFIAFEERENVSHFIQVRKSELQFFCCNSLIECDPSHASLTENVR